MAKNSQIQMLIWTFGTKKLGYHWVLGLLQNRSTKFCQVMLVFTKKSSQNPHPNPNSAPNFSRKNFTLRHVQWFGISIEKYVQTLLQIEIPEILKYKDCFKFLGAGEWISICDDRSTFFSEDARCKFFENDCEVKKLNCNKLYQVNTYRK